MTSKRQLPRLSLPEQARDHLRATVPPARSDHPTLVVIGCDADGAPLLQVEIVDCPEDTSVTECVLVLDNLMAAWQLSDGIATQPSGLLLAITRPGEARVLPFDRTWFRALYRFCHVRGLRPIGMYLVGSGDVRQIQIDDAA